MSVEWKNEYGGCGDVCVRVWEEFVLEVVVVRVVVCVVRAYVFTATKLQTAIGVNIEISMGVCIGMSTPRRPDPA